MAILDCMVRSNLLQMDTRLQVVIPDNRDGKTLRPTKVVYLLHGYGRAADQWSRETFVEKDCARYGFIAVCPDVGHSFYTDLRYGQPFFSYVTEELPEIVARLFALEPSREDTFVAGLSMGGYGAMKMALTYPDRYAAAGSFAGALDVKMLMSVMGDDENSLAFKETIGAMGTEKKLADSDNPLCLLDDVGLLPRDERPRLYQTVGKQDQIYPLNTAFHKKAEEVGVPLLYQEWDGEHNYKFWTQSLSRCLQFFATGGTPDLP